MRYKQIFLKPGKDVPIKNRHHWIFNGAIQSAPNYEDGDILQVVSARNEIIGHGYFNKKTVIAGRMLNFSSEDPIDSLKKNISKAIDFRTVIFDETKTNAYRLINGEGDEIPGLIVDKYKDTLVMQVATTGIDKYKKIIVDELVRLLKPKCIYEKSTMSARLKDGLKPFEGVIYGELEEELIIEENSIKFFVDLKRSQKTGLFIDMREMRDLVGQMSKDRKVLNCFAYTGGFSLYAIRGGALSVDSIDIDPDAVDVARKNFEINGFDTSGNQFIATDAFKFLREDSLDYNFIILDPPAFAKKKDDIPSATKGYGDINRTTLSKIPRNSFLLTCSCSYHVNQEMFEGIVARAARDAKRNVKIIHKHRLAMDHPINIHHSEIDYLKSILLYVY